MSIIELPAVRHFLMDHARVDSGPAPVAVFDCDGTVIRGDIGEAMLYYQLEHFLFRVSPAEVWHDHPRREVLSRLYVELLGLNAEQRTRQQAHTDFCELVLSWYFGRIDDGRIQDACVDIVRLLAGFTVSEVRGIASASYRNETQSSPARRNLGSRTFPKGIRYVADTTDCIAQLQRIGFDIWMISGSNRWSVEPIASRLAIAPQRVIGITLEERGGVLTPGVSRPVPVQTGKIEALRIVEPRKPLIVVSDSKNDRALLDYSAGLKILVNAGKDSSDAFFPRRELARDPAWVVVESPTLMTP